MPGFRKLEQETRKPPSTLLVPPETFAAAWKDRPEEPVACGIRPLSEADLVFCVGEARKFALGVYPATMPGVEDERDRCYNDALMRLGASRGTCDPNDATQTWDVWGRHGGDVEVREALTPQGTKFLWDAIERVTIATSPVRREATNEDIRELLEKAPDLLAALPPWQAGRIRRLLFFCLEDLIRGEAS